MNINTASRADLEVAILENDLEDTLFGGLDAILKMDIEEIREKLIKWVIEGNGTEKTYPAPVEKIMIAIDTHGTEYIFTGYEPNGKIRVQHPNGLNCTVPENRYKLKSLLPNHILKGHYYNYTAGGKFVS